jgi:hypothetical protein
LTYIPSSSSSSSASPPALTTHTFCARVDVSVRGAAAGAAAGGGGPPAPRGPVPASPGVPGHVRPRGGLQPVAVGGRPVPVRPRFARRQGTFLLKRPSPPP